MEPVPCPADPAPILYLRSGPLPEALPPSPPPRGASPPQGRVNIISGNQNIPGYQVSLIYGHLAVTAVQFSHFQNKDSHFQGCLGKSEWKDTTSHHSLSRRHHILRHIPYTKKPSQSASPLSVPQSPHTLQSMQVATLPSLPWG